MMKYFTDTFRASVIYDDYREFAKRVVVVMCERRSPAEERNSVGWSWNRYSAVEARDGESSRDAALRMCGILSECKDLSDDERGFFRGDSAAGFVDHEIARTA